MRYYKQHVKKLVKKAYVIQFYMRFLCSVLRDCEETKEVYEIRQIYYIKLKSKALEPDGF